MDSEVHLDWFLVDIVDEAWRRDTLPHEEVDVPLYELPDPEPESGGVGSAGSGGGSLTATASAPTGFSCESLRQQESRWNDLALHLISDSK